MKAVSVKDLLKSLSVIGLDSIEFLNPQSKEAVANGLAGLCSALLQLKGEVSSIAIADKVLSTYAGSSPEEKISFFHYLNEQLAASEEKVEKAIRAYQDTHTQQDLQALCRTAEAPRLELFRALNMAENGTMALISMREDLLGFLPAHPELRPIDSDLLNLFKAWFNRGFLELKRIDWETPAFVLEKLIEYESVHEIKGWPDLRRRLEVDRRCFGFFHPVIPNVPLIFVEVALARTISSNITDLLNEPVPKEGRNLRNAIFYSINNCLQGLRGVSFGNFLIKQVIENVARDMPTIKAYSTLSPVPGFMNWLRKNLDQLDFVEDDTRAELHNFLQVKRKHEYLMNINALQEALLQLCAYYLVIAKNHDRPVDPVARFHLGNGASLEKINWMADNSANGIEQSAGIMVNYLYDRKNLSRNHEAFEQTGKVTCSSTVSKLLP